MGSDCQRPKIVAQAGITPETRVRDMTESETGKVREILEREYRVEGDLRREFGLSIRRLQEIAATEACGIGAACPFVDSAPRQTPESAKALSARWPGKKKTEEVGERSYGKQTDNQAWSRPSEITGKEERGNRVSYISSLRLTIPSFRSRICRGL